MIVVRVVQRGDVDALMRLAQETGPGLTTFKPDRDALAARVERARRTMEDKAEPHEAGYFFVMEDTDTGDVAGVCGIETVGRPAATVLQLSREHGRAREPGPRHLDAHARAEHFA